MTMKTATRKKSLLLAGVLAIALALVGCSSDDEEGTPSSTTSGASDAPQVSDVWARAAMEGGNTAIYFVIDGGSTADRLVSVSVPEGTGATTEIHETVPVDQDDDADMSQSMGSDSDMDHGDMDDEGHGGGSKMMTMRPVEGIDVPAGGQVVLEPGGYHVMILDLDAALVGGDELPVTLTFEKAGDIEVTAEVREP